MPVKFSYWEHGESVNVEGRNDAELSPDEAMVIATLKVAEETGAVASALKDILYHMQNHMRPEDD